MKLRNLFLAPILAAMLFFEACNTSWITTAQQYVNVLLPVAGEILQILVLTGVALPPGTQTQVAKYSQEATNDLQLVSTLLSNYNKANAATTVQKIQAAMADAAQNLSEIEAAAHVYDPKTQAKVNAAVELATQTIAAILSLVPKTQTQTAGASAALKAAHLPSPGALANQFHIILSQ